MTLQFQPSTFSFYMYSCSFSSAFVQAIANAHNTDHANFCAEMNRWLKIQASIDRLLVANPLNFLPTFGFIDVFAAPPSIRQYHPRKPIDTEALGAKFIMPLDVTERGVTGCPCTVENIEEFRRRLNGFSGRCLESIKRWTGVLVAGGAVQLCLTPGNLVGEGAENSDIDLFFYGVNDLEKQDWVNEFYNQLCVIARCKVESKVTEHATTFYPPPPFRRVQIITRNFKSPAEILARFDVDSCCLAYDGHRVFATARAILALKRQANTINTSKCTPTYELRLSKYRMRGFEVEMPMAFRNGVDVEIFKYDTTELSGLALLLKLENLFDKCKDPRKKNAVIRGAFQKHYAKYLKNKKTEEYELNTGAEGSRMSKQDFAESGDGEKLLQDGWGAWATTALEGRTQGVV